MPLTEAIAQSKLLDQEAYNRLSDYGIGFRKSWVFARGGLPVIYQPEPMRAALPEPMRWRHCELDYNRGIDFSWQREWHVLGERLEFAVADDIIVVVKTEQDAMEWLCGDFCIDHERDEFYYTVNWSYVSHERLCEEKLPNDVETLRVDRG